MSSNVENTTNTPNHDKEFFYNAIKNTQGIIQSVDIKLHVLLGFTAILLVEVIRVFYSLKSSDDTITCLVYCAACAIVGVVSAYYTIRAIQTVKKPDDHVDRTNTLATAFFYGTSFFRGAEGKVSVCEVLSAFPGTDEHAFHELACEFAKLIYIRQIKIERQKCAIKIFFVWVIILLLPMLLITFKP